MSSYAALKQMALKKKEEEQAALNSEREQKERETAAKQAAREAREREEKERERKILVQRMAIQKEEEARERMRKESAAKLKDDHVANEASLGRSKPASSSKADLARQKPARASGSTQRIDLSDVLKKTSRDDKAARRKRKVDEDDFVGNRVDKISLGKKEARSPSTFTSAPKRKSVPMTREEKQAIKRAREFGSIPKLPSSGRIHSGSGSLTASPSISANEQERASRPSARAQLARDNGLVVLGTKKRDHRSIDEIERDLKKLKEAKGEGSSQVSSQAELEREAALLRRQKAMEAKRQSDLEAKGRAALEKGKDDADALFGSDDDEDGDARGARKASSSKVIKESKPSDVANGTRTGPGKASNSMPSAHLKDPKPITSRTSSGINPADFLPGAPLRPEAAARLTQKAKAASGSTSTRKSPDPDAGPRVKRTQSDKRSSPAAAVTVPARRETARDRFIREQEEKKKSAVDLASEGKRGMGRSSADYDSEEEDEYEDEYESDGIDEEDEGGDEGGENFRDEIWKMFGKDRKKYASRIVDSDDDMEADAASVLQEELRSSKRAREEDLREQQLEQQREREKLLRKQAAKRA